MPTVTVVEPPFANQMIPLFWMLNWPDSIKLFLPWGVTWKAKGTCGKSAGPTLAFPPAKVKCPSHT